MVLTTLTNQTLSSRDITNISNDQSTESTNTKNNCSAEEQQLKLILTNKVDPCDGNEFLSEVSQENQHRESYTYPKETISYERDHRSYTAEELNIGLNAIRVVCPWC